ncbi:MAG: 16S rRNA (guanine(527)-N(7))-methyltransferase RsmG [Pseudomonadota bacterium]
MTPQEFAVSASVSPEELEDYQHWARLLRKWNSRINLVAPNSLADFWRRHALDSAQIVSFIPENAEICADFGSGAGFPGLSVAIDAKHSERDRRVHLIESVGKKASFLRTVSRETSLEVIVHAERIEKIEPLSADIVTCRAFAPLDKILTLASRHLVDGGSLVLLKGESVSAEIETAMQSWQFDAERHESLSDESGVVLVISNVRAK